MDHQQKNVTSVTELQKTNDLWEKYNNLNSDISDILIIVNTCFEELGTKPNSCFKLDKIFAEVEYFILQKSELLSSELISLLLPSKLLLSHSVSLTEKSIKLGLKLCDSIDLFFVNYRQKTVEEICNIGLEAVDFLLVFYEKLLKPQENKCFEAKFSDFKRKFLKIIPEIFLNNIDVKIISRVLAKVAQFDFQKEKLMVICQNTFSLLLEKHPEMRVAILESFVPEQIASPDLIDIKHLLRFAYLNPHQIENVFMKILKLFTKNQDVKNTVHNEIILFDPEAEIKELSFLISFSANFHKASQVIFKLTQKNALEILIEQRLNFIYLVVKKTEKRDQKSLFLEEKILEVRPGQSQAISYSHFLLSKTYAIKINKKTIEDKCDFLKKFDHISSAELSFEGHLDYILLFNKSSSVAELENLQSNYSLLFNYLAEKTDLANSLIFSASSETKIFPTASYKLSERTDNLFDIFKQLGGLNCLIPLINLSNKSENFAFLFDTLREFAANINPDYLNELMNENFFKSLRVLMANNVEVPCKKMVKSIAELAKSQKDNIKVIRMIIENVLINSKLWGKVEECDLLITAFDILFDTRTEVFADMFKESYKILEIVKFFTSLNRNNKPFISGYMFEILEKMTESFSKDQTTLLSIINLIAEKMKSPEEGQHLHNFLKKLSDHWKEKSRKQKLEDFDSINFCRRLLDNIFPKVSSGSDLDYALISFILDTFTDHIHMFRKDPITQRVIDFKIDYSREKEFYNYLYVKLGGLGINITKRDILELFFKFTEKSVVKNIINYSDQAIKSSVLANDKKTYFFFDLITNQLFPFFKEHPSTFPDVIYLLGGLMRGNSKLTMKIIDSSLFPFWAFSFFEKCEKPEIEIFYNFFLWIFTQLNCFKNLSALRTLVFYLRSLGKYENGLEFLLAVLRDQNLINSLNEFPVFLIEFLNIVEDICWNYDFSEVNLDVFEKIVEILISQSEFLKYSLFFPDVVSIRMLEKIYESKFDKIIVFREGGVIRQLLFFIFYIMKKKRSEGLEQKLKSIFTGRNFDKKKKEWKTLKNCKFRKSKDKKDRNSNKNEEFSIKQIKVFSKKHYKDFENFILIYSYFEWSECIKQYSSEDKHLSTSALRDFLKQQNFSKKVKILKNEEIFKISHAEMKSVISDWTTWKAQIKPFSYSLSDEVPLLESKVLKFERIEIFIKNSEANIPIDEPLLYFYIFYMTALKILLLSKNQSCPAVSDFSFNKPDDKFSQRSDSLEYLPTYLSSYEIECEQIFKSTLKRYSDIFHIKKTDSLKYSLRNLTDSIGRRIFVHKNSKKYKEFNLRKKSIETLNFKPYRSIGTDFTEDARDSGTNDEESFPEQVKLTTEMLKLDCEIINVYGSFFGSLTICSQFLLFECKSVQKPELGPYVSISESNKKVFRASAASETQLKEDFFKLWYISDIQEVVPKPFMHVKCAFEVYFVSGKSKYFNFFYESDYEKAVRKLSQVRVSITDNLEMAKKCKKDWKTGKISNLEYLLKLNKYSGRSFNTISQYPVFPWILSNYERQEINLSRDSEYRNLAYPIAAQEEFAREKCKVKYELSEKEEHSPYHHGSHYSNGAIALHFLLRIEPFTQQSKNLQGGQFDLPDRLFLSLDYAWKSCQACYGDSKELIPELFYLPELFQNRNKENFKTRQNGQNVEEVLLPPWAKNSIYRFIQVHRKALESPYVSNNLKNWIDLIFGYLQTGSEAKKICNIYHPVTYSQFYHEIVKKYEEHFHTALAQQVLHFGQTPVKLFKKSHTDKKEIKAKEQLAEKLLRQDQIDFISLYKNREISAVALSQNFIVIARACKENNSLKVLRLSINERSPESSKEIELRVGYFSSILIGLTIDDRLVVCDKFSNCFYIFSLAGEIKKKARLFASKITCLSASSVIAAGCSDSSLVVFNENKQIKLFGHFDSINDVVVSDVFLSVISSTNEAVLIHDFRSGEVLNIIEIGARKITCNQFGLIFLETHEKLLAFYMNGDIVNDFGPASVWAGVGDCLVFKQSGEMNVTDPYFEDQKKLSGVDGECFWYNEKSDVLVWKIENEIFRSI